MIKKLIARLRDRKIKMILVKAFFNTDENGKWIDAFEMEEPDIPQCWYGPFVDMDAAIYWMSYTYPDDDTDVFDMEADVYKYPKSYLKTHLNDPDSLFPDEKSA